MVRSSNQDKKIFELLSFFILGAGLVFLEGCKPPKPPLIPKPVTSSEALKQLEIRIKRLEKHIEQQQPTPSNKKNYLKTPIGPVKSLTFRIGTKDDRLRIYWADGTKSDLPCTKEQFIWACG